MPLHDKQYYYGINSAEFRGTQPDYQTIQQAKDRAIKDLSYGLSVDIQSYYQEQLSTYKDEEIKSSLMLSARLVLNGIKVHDQWTDCQNRQHWMVVSINRSVADKQVKEQKFIKQVLKCLKSDQKKIRQSIESMNKIIAMRMKRVEEQYDHLSRLSKVLDRKITESSTQTQKNYRFLIKQIDKLTQTFNQAQQQKNKKISSLLNEQQHLIKNVEIISQKIQSDYFLSFINDDITISASDFQVRIAPENNRTDFFEGEHIRFWVKSNQDCFIKVLYITASGKEYMIFPNKIDLNNYLNANEKRTVGRQDDLIIKKPFGQDTITIVASKKQFTNIKKQIMSANEKFCTQDLNNPLHGVRTRAIGVVEVKNNQTYATDTCYIVSHEKK